MGLKYGEKEGKVFEKEEEKFVFMRENKEWMRDMEGDVVLYLRYKGGERKKEGERWEKDWRRDGVWKKLKGVKRGKGDEVEDGMWRRAGGVKGAYVLVDEMEK